MKAGHITLLAAACALFACSPGKPNEPSPPELASTEAPEPAPTPLDTVTGDEPDLRSQIVTAMTTTNVAGLPIYAQVSKDFPEEFGVMVDAMVAAINGDQVEQDAKAAGGKFSVTLKEKYADHMKSAGPEKIRALLAARRDLFLNVIDVYGLEACNEMARTDKFADDTLDRVGPTFVPYMIASWSAMKAGLVAPVRRDHPTRLDVVALASAALKAGASETAVDAWVTGNTVARGEECNLLVALLNAELAMPGETGERLMAGSTISLPFVQP